MMHPRAKSCEWWCRKRYFCDSNFQFNFNCKRRPGTVLAPCSWTEHEASQYWQIYSCSGNEFLDFQKVIAVVAAKTFLFNVLTICTWYLYVDLTQICGHALNIMIMLKIVEQHRKLYPDTIKFTDVRDIIS